MLAYASQQPLDVVGQFTANATIRNDSARRICCNSFKRASSSRQEIGTTARRTAVETRRPHTVNNSDDRFRSNIEQRYPRLFQGVGKLKDFQAKIHSNPQVRRVSQKPRCIPFVLRKPVLDYLDEFFAKDIIEKVDGSTSWVSPVVVAPKASGEIRLCVDMRRANEVIIRERYPIQTVDKILQSLNRSTVSSKLAL
ncbi:uncharacterized protein LOC134191785 [Corticium candelabrum]|uniref:uncharacterized protein LOC134191785 n=1 Tax=Corticium candelabrum TaxID=121492 RepID=UPI002E26C7CF|nr:uncharacterized protein LOC134191785 [Corticium candelabrum]